MSLRLSDIPRCFEGEIPAMIVTASGDGVPNLGHLSQVYFVDDHHVAISNQFFTKTTDNLAANPLATVLVVDPSQLASYKILVRHERRETAGPTFDVMRGSLEAIAAMSGMSDVFALRAAEVLRVLDIQAVPDADRPGGG